jgi:hypothetical protein
MKIATVVALFFSVSLPTLIAGTPAISIVEYSTSAGSKNIATIRADDVATRDEILNLWEDAKKAFPKDRRNLFGPDAGFVAITITNGEEKIIMRSWHPLYEKNSNTVVTSNGVESLQGRNREEVLRTDKTWYRNARMVFDKILSYTRTKANRVGASPTR